MPSRTQSTPFIRLDDLVVPDHPYRHLDGVLILRNCLVFLPILGLTQIIISDLT